MGQGGYSLPQRRTEGLRGKGSAHIAYDHIGSERSQSSLPALLKTSGDSDERNDRGDADGNADQRESCPDRAAHQTAQHNGKKSHVPGG